MRAAGTTGHSVSAGYVFGQLSAAGYDVKLQPFEFPYFQETGPLVFDQVSPTPTTYESGTDVATMTYSGSGDVTAELQGVDLTLPPSPAPSSTSGCEAADFAGFTAGNIALIQRGGCNFVVKAANADAAGAIGVVIFNEGQPGRTDVVQGTLGAPDVTIPVVGTTLSWARNSPLAHICPSQGQCHRRSADHLQRDRRDQGWPCGQRGHARRPPGQLPGGTRYQRQRIWQRRAAGDRQGAAQGRQEAGQQGPLRVVVR